MKGFVTNNALGVQIVVCATADALTDFVTQIQAQKPAAAQIVAVSVREMEHAAEFEGFSIKPTQTTPNINLPLTPDFAQCAQCAAQMLDPHDRRYFYPFTCCTQCGTRYAITEKYPFERENTSLATFKMCATCQTEYDSPEDVRFHAQTNSCPDCGIKFWLTDNFGKILTQENQEVFGQAAKALSEGKILAVKNTSGYLLLCDATSVQAVQQLRERKRRPTKPLAVLFPDLAQLRQHVYLSEKAAAHIGSAEAPIVVAEVKNKGAIALQEVAPNMDTLGCMLPYSGILKLLATQLNRPLVATSGNLHGSPVCADAPEAFEKLSGIADLFIHHDLPVRHSQDDSVIRFTPKYDIKLVYRRARGLAPSNYFEPTQNKVDNTKILCLGSDLKSSVSLQPNSHSYTSEYLGDLGNYETFQRFEATLSSYAETFSLKPDVIVHDLHPLYQSRQAIEPLQQRFPAARLHAVQHHEAHFAAILGEKNSWENKVLGVIWDGTGYGTDAAIWGGEFFLYEKRKISRAAHLNYFIWILGDKMAKNPKISAYAILGDALGQENFEANEQRIYARQREQKAVQTSSVGRLFDAAAYVLGFERTVFFEGEAAMYVEQLAKMCGTDAKNVYLDSEDFLSGEKLLANMRTALGHGASRAEVAAGFHWSLAKMIQKVAVQQGATHIAFSGGVFQNAYLVDCIAQKMNDLTLSWHEHLPANDENISYGQLKHYQYILQ
ncbi:hydrogenase maturation protein HypF [Flexibacter flexilis DSM 6793]|uniref:Hydrogenase maturation protein HypF n=2 Tax=Flexibacter flexilis TaxID=998 RepID=A0A1I1IBL9_9BACT|nr:hydrogenase maturation protein HypF [Flexibacter flexilis DSM 6793]